jgi:hypothetical protein
VPSLSTRVTRSEDNPASPKTKTSRLPLPNILLHLSTPHPPSRVTARRTLQFKVLARPGTSSLVRRSLRTQLPLLPLLAPDSLQQTKTLTSRTLATILTTTRHELVDLSDLPERAGPPLEESPPRTTSDVVLPSLPNPSTLPSTVHSRKPSFRKLLRNELVSKPRLRTTSYSATSTKINTTTS